MSCFGYYHLKYKFQFSEGLAFNPKLYYLKDLALLKEERNRLRCDESPKSLDYAVKNKFGCNFR